ncbi:MAG: exopolygalacturonase, partial [Lachnospiraceae bacterium]|nr:exopolygalacturonase [Lachnospiraceae bacterium]
MNNNETTQLTHFPDGTPIDPWFRDYTIPDETDPKRRFVLQEYGILPESFVQTKAIQELIDHISADGGGTIVVTGGTFRTGALYFKQGVNLEIAKNGILQGSTDITDYPLCETRIEGETCLYYPGLINAIGLDGFHITGEGAIDGNGLPFWKAFWLRRAWNPQCTNKEEQRPRLFYA